MVDSVPVCPLCGAALVLVAGDWGGDPPALCSEPGCGFKTLRVSRVGDRKLQGVKS